MPRSDLVQSLTRALDIIEIVSRSEDGVTLRDLCRITQLKAPTAHNLARTLVARGFLEKLASPPRYRLGPAVAALSLRQVSASLAGRAVEVMKAVKSQLPDASVVLAQPVAGEMVKVMRIGSERAGIIQHCRQTMAPYITASTMLYQAFAGAEAVAAYRARYPFFEHGVATWPSETRYDEALATTRERGIAMLELPQTNTLTMSAPVMT
jgi:DNA-binding IclR family transcriptional regulator